MKNHSGFTDVAREGKEVVLRYQDCEDPDLDTEFWYSRKQALNLAIALLEAME